MTFFTFCFLRLHQLINNNHSLFSAHCHDETPQRSLLTYPPKSNRHRIPILTVAQTQLQNKKKAHNHSSEPLPSVPFSLLPGPCPPPPGRPNLPSAPSAATATCASRSTTRTSPGWAEATSTPSASLTTSEVPIGGVNRLEIGDF